MILDQLNGRSTFHFIDYDIFDIFIPKIIAKIHKHLFKIYLEIYGNLLELSKYSSTIYTFKSEVFIQKISWNEINIFKWDTEL